jgi:hypothetical protein
MTQSRIHPAYGNENLEPGGHIPLPETFDVDSPNFEHSEHEEKTLEGENGEHERLYQQMREDSVREVAGVDSKLEHLHISGVDPKDMLRLRQEVNVDGRLAENTEKIDTLLRVTKDRIHSAQFNETIESADSSQNQSREQSLNTEMQEGRESREAKVEYIKNSFGNARADVLEASTARTVVSNGLNLVPFAGPIKMVFEGICGKGLDGEEIKGKDRVIHIGMAAASLALDLVGVGEIEKGALFVGKSVSLLEGLAAKALAKGASKSAALIGRTAKFVAENPKLALRAEEFAEMQIQKHVKDIREYKKGVRRSRTNVSSGAREDELAMAA